MTTTIVITIIMVVLCAAAFFYKNDTKIQQHVDDVVEFEGGRRKRKMKIKVRWMKTWFTTYTPEQTSTGSQYGVVYIPGHGNLPTVAVNCFNWEQYGGAVLELRNSAGKTIKVYVNDICGGRDGGNCLARTFNIDLSVPARSALFHPDWFTTEEGSFRDVGGRYFEPLKWNRPGSSGYDACEGAFAQRRYP